MESNKLNNEPLSNEELNYLNKQIQLLLISNEDEGWQALEKKLLKLKSEGFVFSKTETQLTAEFNSNLFLKLYLLNQIVEKKNHLIKAQLYDRCGSLRSVEKKILALKEEQFVCDVDLFTTESKTIFYKQPQNVFVEALLTMHLGAVLDYWK